MLAAALFAGAANAAPPLPEDAPPEDAPPEDALPFARAAYGRGDFRIVWLVKPTDRYPHGALGDPTEAAALRVRFADGGMAEITLPDDQVFEDLEPRLVDADGDGRDEIMVVRARADKGASLALYGLREACDGDAAGRTLALLAETRPIGQPKRWLNPIGVADFDGDGKPEIALARTPHLNGVLEIYRLTEGRLVKLAELAGYSNHVFGSRAQRLAAVADMNGDGIADIVVPTQDRRAIAVVSFAGGALREIRREPTPAAAAGEFSVVSPATVGAPKDQPPEVWIGLEEGARYTLKASR